MALSQALPAIVKGKAPVASQHTHSKGEPTDVSPLFPRSYMRARASCNADRVLSLQINATFEAILNAQLEQQRAIDNQQRALDALKAELNRNQGPAQRLTHLSINMGFASVDEEEFDESSGSDE